MTYSAIITTTSALIDTTGVLIWEYSTGAGLWAALPLSAANADSPYDTHSDITFGYNETIMFPSSAGHQIRFGDIDGTWNTDTVNGIGPSYWIRARITDAANIVQVPVLTGVKLGTNRYEINNTGFIETYGTARHTKSIQIPMSSLTATGIGGETAPPAQRLVADATISSLIPNSLFANSTLTTAAFIFNPGNDIDTSYPVKLILTWSRSVSGANNVALEVVRALVSDENSIGNPAGSTGNATQTTGIVAYPTSAANRSQFKTEIYTSALKFIPTRDELWFKIARHGSDALDTYNNSIYLISVQVEYVTRSNGGYITEL